MNSWTEEFGKFMTLSVDTDATKEIILCSNNTGRRMSPGEMVILAIRLAKQYNCNIVEPVEYTPEMVGGRIHFTIECHRLTYRYFYAYGNLSHLSSSEVTEKDLAKYEQQFHTRKCIQRGFKKRWWFNDKWDGHRHEFLTLKAAKAAAKEQCGASVTIYTNYPYGRTSEIACFADASGFMPP
jgi:hypothetical protein